MQLKTNVELHRNETQNILKIRPRNMSRPGSAQARDYFSRNISNAAAWRQIFLHYNEAVAIVAASKKKPTDLASLDKFRKDLGQIALSRQPPHITRAELSKIMTWKLTRGKFRPLQKLVDSNSETAVVAASTESFQLATDPSKWKESVNALAVLKGVGVATASAVLAATHQHLFPFMADETIEAVVSSGEREYNMNCYTELRDLLSQRVCILGGDWNVAELSDAVWVYAIFAGFGRDTSQFDNIESTDAAVGLSTPLVAAVATKDGVDHSEKKGKVSKRKESQPEPEVKLAAKRSKR